MLAQPHKLDSRSHPAQHEARDQPNKRGGSSTSGVAQIVCTTRTYVILDASTADTYIFVRSLLFLYQLHK